ncbi:hypothetical protein H1R20_g16433, partial [Candolleomyces eurysporus]
MLAMVPLIWPCKGQTTHLGIAEMCARLGRNVVVFPCLTFRKLVKTPLVDHPAHLSLASLAYFDECDSVRLIFPVHSFSGSEKSNYSDVEDDDNVFNLTCFNAEGPTILPSD